MRKEITIGNESVEMAASAATPFLYQKVFHEDLLRSMQKDPENVSTYIRLAFVLAKQADTPLAEMLQGKVTEESFVEWLDQYETMDLMEAVADVLQLYQESKKGSSVPKTKAD